MRERLAALIIVSSAPCAKVLVEGPLVPAPGKDG